MVLRDVLAEIIPVSYAWAALGLLVLAVLVYFFGIWAAIREHRYDPAYLNEWFESDGIKYFSWLGITFGINVVMFAAKQVGPEWEPVARGAVDALGGGSWISTSVLLALGWLNDLGDKWARIRNPDPEVAVTRQVKRAVRPARLGEPDHPKSKRVQRKPLRPSEQVNV